MIRIVAKTLSVIVIAAALSAGGPTLRAQTEPGAARLPAEDQKIAAIRVVTEAGEVLEENPASLPLKPGAAYRAELVRESLRWLYRTGRYADVRAEAAETSAGLRLDFVVRGNFYVNIVRVAGLDEKPSESWALAALRLPLGAIFRESELREALERLRQALETEGLYEAKLDSALAPNPETRQINITVRVTPGRRAQVGAIALRNPTAYTRALLLRRAKLRTGDKVTASRLERASARARKFLAGRGHLSARVVIRRGNYDPQSNTLPLEIEVFAGGKVRVEVAGAKIPKGELRKLLPIYAEATVDEDLLQEGRRAIRDHLERQGYFDSQVSYTTRQEDGTGEQVITYSVQPGVRRRLVGISIEGNRYFSDEMLRGRLRLVPAAFLSRGRFSQRLLHDAEESIRALYVANGFREAQVRPELLENYQNREGNLFVRFHVTEGPQTLVAGFRLEGNRTLGDATLLAGINTTPCQPYSDFNVTGDRDNVLALYFNEGFPDARFSFRTVEVSDAAEALRKCPQHAQGGRDFQAVELSYQIEEGPQIKVGRVLVDGYAFTRRDVIAREVQIQPGDPLREGAVLDTQRRLYDLGIFNRVTIAPQNPEGTDAVKPLVVMVEEAKRYTIAYGGGIEIQRLGGAGNDPVGGEVRTSPRGLLEITKANFAGRAHTLSFKARGSSLQGRGLVSYTTPKFLTRPSLTLLITVFADKSRNIRTFSATRYEASAQLAQRVSPTTSLLYRYAYRRVSVGSLRIDPVEVPLFSQPTRVSSFGASWVREQRDNPADATKGQFNTVDLSVAGKPIGSSASFVRVFLQNSSYHPLGRGVVFARAVRFGLQEPFGDTVISDIPLPERFFAGGGQTLRGFGLNQAGPRDAVTGFPIGGLTMLVFNQELRFPMRLPYVGNRVGGALFYDAGNVFHRANRITFRASVPKPVFNPLLPNQCVLNCTNALNYFSHTIGFGFRYATPIGPVRLDLGYQLNPQRFLIPDGLGGQRLARLPRFQFFFNFGPSF
jgi:outer membrane protein assembly complex protein YaeT